MYKVIADELRLQRFVDWLPELGPDGCFMLALLARNKYYTSDTGSIGSKVALKRVTATKETFIQKIRQMECPLGAYRSKGQAVPQETLALYVTVNPRSQQKAAAVVTKKLLDKLLAPKYDGYNPHQIALSAIQDSVGDKRYVDFDFDGADFYETVDRARQYVNLDAITAIKTRGGFHLLVEVRKIEPQYQKTNWYMKIAALPGLDETTTDLLPVPGCYQGGFTPQLVTPTELTNLFAARLKQF